MKRTHRRSLVYQALGWGLLLAALMGWAYYGPYVLGRTDIRATVRGSVDVAIRKARQSARYSEVHILRDDQISLTIRTPSDSRLVQIRPLIRTEQQGIQNIQHWCSFPPASANADADTAYTVGMRCPSVSAVQVFVVSPDLIPGFIRELLEEDTEYR